MGGVQKSGSILQIPWKGKCQHCSDYPSILSDFLPLRPSLPTEDVHLRKQATDSFHMLNAGISSSRMLYERQQVFNPSCLYLHTCFGWMPVSSGVPVQPTGDLIATIKPFICLKWVCKVATCETIRSFMLFCLFSPLRFICQLTDCRWTPRLQLNFTN